MRIRPDLASKVIIHFPFIPDTPRYAWQEPVAWPTTKIFSIGAKKGYRLVKNLIDGIIIFILGWNTAG